jgi:hypothetical protein
MHVDVSCIEGKRVVGSLRLDHGANEGYMFDPSVMVLILLLVFRFDARPSGDHVDDSPERWVDEFFLLRWRRGWLVVLLVCLLWLRGW